MFLLTFWFCCWPFTSDLTPLSAHSNNSVLSLLCLERGAKPVTNFVKNLSALSDWYSIYTSAIAFIVSYPIPPEVVRTYFKMYYLWKFIETAVYSEGLCWSQIK